MSSLSPKIEIINHFDQLINRVDIDIDECLENYTEEQDLSQIEKIRSDRNYSWYHYDFRLETEDSFDSSKHSGNQTVDLWLETTKVVEYLKEVRMRTIEELKKAQEDTLKHFKLNSSQFKSDEKNIDELKSLLFADKFYFQVYFTQSKKRYWPLNLFTFVTDFYMSPSDINILEELINEKQSRIYAFSQKENKIVFDEKMILIGVLLEYFIENILSDEKFPNHVIHVRKQDVLDISSIDFKYSIDKIDLTGSSLSIDMSKLRSLDLFRARESIEVNIEGKLLPSLSTLKLVAKSIKDISLRNLESVEIFSFRLSNETLDESMARNVFDHMPNIRELSLDAHYSNLKLDNLVNLKKLEIDGFLNDDFNFDLFQNLCQQLEKLSFHFYDVYNNVIVDLFYDNHFPNLKSLSFLNFGTNVLKKKFIKRFPMLEHLNLDCSNISYIEIDAFSNMKQLVNIYLRDNCIELLDKRHFLELVNLKRLYLNKNQIKIIEKNMFSTLKNLEYLNLGNNQISSLDPESFIGLGNLNSLYLYNNKFRRFDVKILDHIPKIELIDLREISISNKDELLIRSKSSLFRFY